MRGHLFCTALSIALPYCVSAGTSDWLSAPKPTFPTSALKNGSEGSIKFQVVLAKDGHVTAMKVLRSSGDPILDAAAQQGVWKWRMKPSAIKPSDLTRGREVVIEFKQEAVLAAVYPDRKAYFTSQDYTDVWMFAPFPAYPLSVRQKYHTGKVLVRATIGGDGRVVSVQVLQSSGHSDLDELAVKAVSLWRAHKQFSGKQYVIPIDFVIGGRHY
ncbi:MAG TPA: energy transducer TonB [Chthoniobacterales bacterium]|nr:energy transducer TonB [Chthoniobacterales bacterium]